MRGPWNTWRFPRTNTFFKCLLCTPLAFWLHLRNRKQRYRTAATELHEEKHRASTGDFRKKEKQKSEQNEGQKPPKSTLTTVVNSLGKLVSLCARPVHIITHCCDS